MWWKKYYYDQHDYELLSLVNKVVTLRHGATTETIFDANLHPHGIKALAMTREMRVAHAVVHLLDSLEAGHSADRLRALRTLYDEVLGSAQTSLRRNTARVLVQIMKDMVRAHGDEARQLLLAHDFRRAAQGRPRVVRALLDSYHLVEMPEDWSQLSFDHHVHDANTKGRKNPTHLIMDAWIKGIRYLTVIYYNYVEHAAARELMWAADIMGMSVRIGIEFSAPFRGRYVHFIWVPRGFSDAEHFMNFLTEPQVCHIMELGHKASTWQQRYVFLVLERWNEKHRHTLGHSLGLSLPPVNAGAFRAFVGTGQPSLLHLAEHIYNSIQPVLNEQLVHLHEAWVQAQDAEARKNIEQHLIALESLVAAALHDTWLIPEKNPDLPSPHLAVIEPDTPELLRQTPQALLDWLTSLHSGYRITLILADLSVEDVLELLMAGQGYITHLEIFNLKDWYEGRLSHLEKINALQQAINRGSAPRLKRLIRDMLAQYEHDCDKPEYRDRCEKLRHILRNIPTLQEFYKPMPLRSRMGTDSTSRAQKVLGMGLVFPETLTPRGQKYFDNHAVTHIKIPCHIEVNRHVDYSPNLNIPQDSLLLRFVRRLPFGANAGYSKRQEWNARSASVRITEANNVFALGGSIAAQPTQPIEHVKKQSRRREMPKIEYMNTNISNVLKVLAGFIPAMMAFQYTQSWWFLAWFGPIIWFAITGVRNIVQAVLAGRGLHRGTLLRWNDHVSWQRLCESLMYTGFSVPLLELGVRTLLLQETLGYTVSNNQIIVYTCMSVVNGLYLASHNIYRGLPRAAVIGNLFRSALAIPVAMFYNEMLLDGLLLLNVANPLPLIQPGAAIISKTASDTVAALIEGYADRMNNMRMRHWDYQTKLNQIFATYARLELLLPEEDALALLHKPKRLFRLLGTEHKELKAEIIINALDCMHFWLYQPRAQDVFHILFHEMTPEERSIVVRSQLVLVQEREVSQLFVDGMVGRDFGRSLAFYLDKHEDYLRVMMRLPIPRPVSKSSAKKTRA